MNNFRRKVVNTVDFSTLLSNIMLNELDKEMERRGLYYVRYADDFSIYTKNVYAARKTGNSIYLFLKDRSKLPLNRKKSGIRKPVNFTILGYGFVPTYVKGEKGIYQLVASKKSWKSLMQKVKTITRKTIPFSFDERVQKLNEIGRGWLNYFRMASLQAKLKDPPRQLTLAGRSTRLATVIYLFINVLILLYMFSVLILSLKLIIILSPLFFESTK